MKETLSFAEPTRGFLEKHPALRHVDALCVDICGTPRGKRYPADKLKSLYGEGMQMPQSHFLLDVNGDNSDPVGRGYSDGDPDTTLYPVPGSLVPVPWAGDSLAQVIVSERPADHAQGQLLVDPRQILIRMTEKFAALGLVPVMAVELEFYLFDRRAGRGRPAAPRHAGQRPAAGDHRHQQPARAGAARPLPGRSRGILPASRTCRPRW